MKNSKRVLARVLVLAVILAPGTSGWLEETIAQVTVIAKDEFQVEQIAISLREMRHALDSPEAARLYGATWMRGFVLDTDQADCILLVFREPDRPTLRLDDLAVAYRNVTESPGMRPACTIDPRPETIRALSDLGHRTQKASDLKQIRALMAEWERIGRADQDVRVFGVSPDTHFAKVMVEADYRMKGAVDGSERFPGVTSLKQRMREKVERDLAQGRPLSIPTELINRFWFNPGQPGYHAHDAVRGMFIVGQLPVVLKTEQQAATPMGQLQGREKPHPLALEFSQMFTAAYQQIALDKPLYAELESLYRYVAVCDLFLQVCDDQQIQATVDDLIRRIKIPRYEPLRTLPGLATVEEVKWKVPQGERYLHLPSCGGVSIDVRIDLEEHRVPTPEKLLAQATNDILRSRPSPRSVWWVFQSDSLRQLGGR